MQNKEYKNKGDKLTTRFINATIITMNETNEIIFNGEVDISGNLISYVGKSRDLPSKANVIDCKNKILMPGFINTHCHNAMSLMRGLGADVSFETWWHDYMLPIEETLTDDDIQKGTLLSALEMIRAGITTTVDLYLNGSALANALNKAKIRAFVNIGAEFGRFKEVDLQKLEQEYQEIKNISSIITPITFVHAVYSTEESVYIDMLAFAKKHNLVFTTHASETLDEVGRCHTLTGLTPIGLLEKYGAFDDVNCILAHCVHLDKDDVNILKEYPNVSISTNPSSNLYLGSGIAPLFSYLENNINVCMGTDGPASNNCLNMFKEMYLAKNLQAGVMNNPALVSNLEALKMATINGAKALNIKNLGSLKKDYLADMILIDNSQANMQPQHDVISNIVNSCGVQNVVLTMVNGKILYQDGAYNLDIDIPKLIKEISNIQKTNN